MVPILTEVNYVFELKKIKDITELPFPIRQDEPLKEVLSIDQKTKDHHVPRDPELLRLTGSHPFNCEPPLSKLYDSGFLTPVNLHFVRNHGPVPQVPDQSIMDWEISIEGMVDKPYKLKLSEIIESFDIYTVPITLVCAGNRRKEQNMVKKGTGFNWGAAGTSTSLWTGCMLGDVIAKAKPHKKARYIWMEGCDSPANGAYGTCVRLHWAMDPERSIMVSYKQNGEWLQPDHGKPLRVVIPGVIGGRSVKWLRKLIVSDRPSENWYHYFDNRVLPTMVTPEMAKSDDRWWKDERYAIYDLNLQTVICKPENQQVVKISDEEFEIAGFGYNGGGIRIGRVEISLDKGRTWKLADIDYPEDQYREAGYFRLFGGLVNVCDRMSCLCWCFWKLKVPISELSDAKDIVVRGMDERMVVQPRTMYWNVTSMLNNWWYRVAIIKEGDSLRFEHPVVANKPGGWMDRVKAEGGDILDENWGEVADFAQTKERKPIVDEDIEMMCNPDKMNVIISKAEFESHQNNDKEPWFVVKGHVFDGTSYLDDHPGGVQSIVMVSGEDATEDFIAIHSSYAKKLLPPMHLGILEQGGVQSSSESSSIENVKRDSLLDPKKWHKITLAEKEIISSDSRIFKFDLEHEDQLIGLPTGKHLFLRLKDASDKFVMRAYTPKSLKSLKGRLEILIKVYFPCPEYSNGGIMTNLIEKLAIGSTIEVKGPVGEFEYLKCGSCTFNEKPYQMKHFVMISGGSGITPTYQVIQAIFSDPEDRTSVRLFFGNRTLDDILLKQELDELAQKHPEQFKVDYALSDMRNIPQDWRGLTGRLSYDLLDSYVSNWSTGEYMLLVCGPPGMNNSVESWCKERNIDKQYVVYF
ncbi:hypothetical protein OGAPHI_000892 [Ogataea philodendri]|uniref:Nitrate reductase n=1 Tax=Ogataea philodendri TaxID=1378263 RepID=A0A9P8PFM0_9ASCO|nr:uncharacterized protein OGAPHI_000892 [Ogataea philodendri]KAH3670377.1 hypothetical protein OGAPHI_000892 [Ogataea philodendri]